MLKSPAQPSLRLLSLTAEHALRALLYLAGQARESTSAGEIARAIGAPPNYLAKTLQVLARHGLVAGTRGPSGGFRLTHDPEAVTVARIASLFSDTARSPMCLLGGTPCSHEHACAAHGQWLELHAEITRKLDEITLASLLHNEANLHSITTTSGGWS
jgi:Rrf2 family iron-sulfur cluster assembly transcriptional regulator